jgi:hypothetical protein
MALAARDLDDGQELSVAEVSVNAPRTPAKQPARVRDAERRRQRANGQLTVSHSVKMNKKSDSRQGN